MKVELSTATNANFQAKVSPEFVKKMENFINRRNCRLQNIYKLNDKIKEFETFGYDDYTLDILDKSNGLNWQYILLAKKDGEPITKSIFLGKKDSLLQVFISFLCIHKRSFKNRIKSGNTYRP